MEITLIAITAVSALVAVAMTIVAWRLSREQRQRSDARIAALAADIGAGPEAELALHETPAPATVGPLFASSGGEVARPHIAAVIAAGALIVGMAISTIVLFSSSSARESAAAPAARQITPPSALPLELVALTHERDDDRLTVRGIVRNPPQGASMNDVVAVVLLFNHEGGFVASARTEIDALTFGPGREASFVVTVPASDVGRYRVSFRTADRVVPHVDTRKS